MDSNITHWEGFVGRRLTLLSYCHFLQSMLILLIIKCDYQWETRQKANSNCMIAVSAQPPVCLLSCAQHVSLGLAVLAPLQL